MSTISFRSVKAVLVFVLLTWLALEYSKASVQAQDLPSGIAVPGGRRGAATSSLSAFLPAGIVYSQRPGATGQLLQSSWWDPDGSDYDQYVWDGYVLASTQVITEVRWRGGYDPARLGSGGPILDFSVAIYPSIAGGSQPAVTNPPLVRYSTGGNAGETPVGTFGGTAMYDYRFTLPTPFEAAAGARYWVQIEAWQHGIPDWGIARATAGDGIYFRRIANVGDVFYQIVSGDAAFSLLGPASPAYQAYLPFIGRSLTTPRQTSAPDHD